MGMGWGKIIGDMGASVTGDEIDMTFASGKGDAIAFVEEDGLAGDAAAIVSPAIDGQVGEGVFQGPITANMVGVMVGVEDSY